MGEDELLTVDLSSMDVESYATLRWALEANEYSVVAEVLDKYTAGGLLHRHWLCWYSAVEQAARQIDEGQQIVQQAQQAVAAARETAATWAAMTGKPRATWEQ